jgi:hypothetical protein
VWEKIAAKHKLIEPKLNSLEVVTDMSKSRRLGFLDYVPTDDSFLALFQQLRDQRVIP